MTLTSTFVLRDDMVDAKREGEVFNEGWLSPKAEVNE
jgi:hypothetical protein